MTEASPRTFVHDVCNGSTEMPADQVQGRLTNPHGYNDWVYCRKCDGYVARRECRWDSTGENLAEFFDRAKTAAAPPTESKGVLAAPLVLAALGWAIGRFVLGGDEYSVIGLLVGFGVGVLLLVLRKYGLR